MQNCDAGASGPSQTATAKHTAASDSIPRENLVPLPHCKTRKHLGKQRRQTAELGLDSKTSKSVGNHCCETGQKDRSAKAHGHESFSKCCHAEENAKKLRSFLTEHEDLVRRKLLESTEAILQHMQCLANGACSAQTLQPRALDDNLPLAFEDKLQQIHVEFPVKPFAVLDPVYNNVLESTTRLTKETSQNGCQRNSSPFVLPRPPSIQKIGSNVRFNSMSSFNSGTEIACSGNDIETVLRDSETSKIKRNSEATRMSKARRSELLAELPRDYVSHLQTTFSHMAETQDKMSLEKCKELLETFADGQVEFDNQNLIDILKGGREEDQQDQDSGAEQTLQECDEWVNFKEFTYLMSCGEFESADAAVSSRNSGTIGLTHQALNALEDRRMALAAHAEVRRQSYPRLMFFMECGPAIVIISNAVAIGMRADMQPEAFHWKVLDVVFLVCYVMEAAVKLWVFGCDVYWCGPEWNWNWFDMICILVSVSDMSLMYIVPLINPDVDVDQFGDVGVMKMLRLSKLGRLVKALRYPVFNELKAMVFGVVSGVRVILWAIVLLFACVFFLGTVMNLMVGKEFKEFETVPSSMFTVFRCFTDGCTGYDGTPLQEPLRKEYGVLFIIAYTFSFMFITVGVFNLIMATFIDNVLHTSELRKQEELGQLSERIRAGLQSTAVRIIIKMNKMKRHRVISEHLQRKIEAVYHKDTCHAFHMLPGNLAISKPFFEQWVQDKEFLKVLAEADIDMSCTSNLTDLFDVLDADMSGELTLEELIDGLMRLRGPITKRDMVGVRTQVRCCLQALRERDDDADWRGQRLSRTLTHFGTELVEDEYQLKAVKSVM